MIPPPRRATRFGSGNNRTTIFLGIIVAFVTVFVLLVYAPSLLSNNNENENDNTYVTSDDDKRKASAPIIPGGFPRNTRFLAYLPYDGGFNNRRLQLEAMAWLAMLMNRTLILPPTTTALFGQQERQQHEDDNERTTRRRIEPEDAYDLELLKREIPAVSSEEFSQRGGWQLLKQPPFAFSSRPRSGASQLRRRRRRKWRSSSLFSSSSSSTKAFFGQEPKQLNCDVDPHSVNPTKPSLWWRKQCQEAALLASHSAARWLDYDLAHFYAVPFSNFSVKDDAFQLNRRPLRIPTSNLEVDVADTGGGDDDNSNNDKEDPPLMFDATEEGFRVFGNLAVVNTNLRPDLKPLLRKMRDIFQYQEELQQLAKRAVSALGGTGFAAFHFRRTDYKSMFPHLVSDPPSILARFRKLLVENSKKSSHNNNNKVIFIASDDDAEVMKILNDPVHRGCIFPAAATGDDGDGGWKIVTWTDLESRDPVLKNIRPAALKPLVTQLILAASAFFVGHERSSLSSYVVRLRGYNGLEQQTYFSGMGMDDELLRPIVFLPAMNQGVTEASWVWRDLV